MENTHPNYPDEGIPPATVAGEQMLADIDQLQQALIESEAKLGEMRDTVLRERADLDNQRKRLARDLEQARRFANERLLSDLLPVCDNLERGLSVENADTAALREGMDLTLKALLKVAESNGLKPLDPVGEVFNPELHQAVSAVDAPGRAPNTVVAVFQKGYVLNERLLRPALVTVAKAADA